MKYIAILVSTYILMSVLACGQYSNTVPDQVPYGKSPLTPTQEALEAKEPMDAQVLTESRFFDDEGRATSRFYLNDAPYSGWSYQEFTETDHRHRYTRYEEGWRVWQIGFYDNGQLDHDFHMMKGRTLGSERMWRRDGKPYIDYYYSEVGAMDGFQRRWHVNDILAREGLYEEGKLIYELLFDYDGEITDSKGSPPNKK